MILNTSFEDRIEVGEGFVKFIGHFGDDPDLLRAGGAGQDAGGFIGTE